MAYTVLVVDDEPMIRLGISSCIHWGDEGFVLAGELANGEAALQFVKEQEVNILITDIKMPLMDGLELTRQVSRLFPNIKVILISSYNDFEFAREAVKLGVVVDYILKPTMEPEDLLQILRVCKSQLDETAARVHDTDIYIKEAEKAKLKQLEDSLKKMLGGETGSLPWTPDWLKEPLILSIWKQDNRDASDRNTLSVRPFQLEGIKERLGLLSAEAISFITYEHEIVAIMADHKGSTLPLLERFHSRLLSEEGTSFTVGISPSFHHVHRMPNAYSWAKKALEKSFFGGTGCCYTGKITTEIQTDSNEIQEVAAADLAKWASLREHFSQMLAIANQEESRKVIEACYRLWDEQSLARKTVISQAQSLLTMMWSGNARLNSEEVIGLIVNKLQEVLQMSTLAELKKFMNKEFAWIWEEITFPIVITDSGSAHAVQLAISYIQERYRGDLSLQEVADHVHMSKNYLSEQFKRLLGMNFIDFVIRLRIRYAKRLLKTTSLRVYDIGNQAGFKSSKHFLKLFKREVQYTPVEYRQQQLHEDDMLLNMRVEYPE